MHNINSRGISKNFMNKTFKSYILILMTFFIIFCRFISIRHMPDVFCDEQDILNHMQSIIASGFDTNGNYLPLFPKVGLGLATFTYIYPMMFFLSIIGVSAIKARFIQQLFTITACFLVAYSMKIWSNEKRIFWITLFTGLTLPWGFVQANRIWDPSFVPFYFSIYFYFFTLLIKKKSQTSIVNTIYAVLSFCSLVLLATVYPPARIPSVAMWIYSFIWVLKSKKINFTQVIIIFIFSTLLALPLALNLLNPAFNSRSMSLFIFNQDMKLHQQFFHFCKGFAELFNPVFLFIGGDKISRHSLPIFGVLGTLSFIPLITLLRTKKLPSLANYMFFIIGMTYFSTALTYEYQPHSLRSCLAWLPYVILLSYGWSSFLNSQNQKQKAFWYFILFIQFCFYFISFILINHQILIF